MDRGSVPSTSRGHRRAKRKRNPRGLICKPRSGYWWVFGTLHASGQSVRVRRSLGLPADRPEEDAQAARRTIEDQIIGQVVHGIAPSRTFAEAAARYLTKPRARPLGPRTIAITQAVTRHLGNLDVAAIGAAQGADYATRCLRGRKAQTIERHYTQILAVLNFAVRLGWLDKAPRLERDATARNPKPSQRKVKGWLRDAELELVVSCAAPHLRPVLAVLAATGARVSEIVYLSVNAFILAQGRSRVRLEDTKNGGSYGVALDDWAAGVVAEALEGRQDRAGPAFLTDRGFPYADTERKWGGQIKTGFRSACRRAAEIIEAEWGEADRAAVVRRATPHWLRHSFAMNLLEKGVDPWTVMQGGRWEDMRSFRHYLHEVPAHVRAAIEGRQLGTNLTQRKRRGRKNVSPKGA